MVEARRQAEQLEKRGKEHWLEPTIERTPDLAFVTAFLRLLSNIMVLVATLYLFHMLELRLWQDGGSVLQDSSSVGVRV